MRTLICRLRSRWPEKIRRDQIEALAKAEPNTAKFMHGLEIRKVIIVPGKIVNIVAA